MVVEDEGDETSEPPKLVTKQSSSRPSQPSNWLTNFHRDLVAGALMGGVVHTIVAPIERAKLLLQTQESNVAIVAGPHRRFKGMVDCIARTVREEGIFSLWRGNGSSVLRYYPSVALNFSLKGRRRRAPCAEEDGSVGGVADRRAPCVEEDGSASGGAVVGTSMTRGERGVGGLYGRCRPGDDEPEEQLPAVGEDHAASESNSLGLEYG
ncbi:hypothetical protein RJ639_013335 [Escallonia herrerae]|uniref:ADP/ATP translocase n=1 Tax=Escallonia herrerae TaxID=1293975 RepID=A0AA89AM41_9ASTE|nr:hypothetical protein RJ639_013335 [Escallonia herrerae]